MKTIVLYSVDSTNTFLKEFIKTKRSTDESQLCPPLSPPGEIGRGLSSNGVGTSSPHPSIDDRRDNPDNTNDGLTCTDKQLPTPVIDENNTRITENIQHLFLPMCVAALQQTAGKGRYAREWSSPPGGLYMSFAEDLTRKNIPATAYPLCAAVAVHRWLKRTYKITDMFIKWPNDVYINMKKLCGILSTVQTCGESSVIITGIGINVRNDVPENGTSLALLFPNRSFNLHTMLQSLVREIENAVDDADGMRAYITDYLWGKDQIRKLTIHGHETRGIIRGIADDFSLLLEDEHTGTVAQHSLGELE